MTAVPHELDLAIAAVEAAARAGAGAADAWFDASQSLAVTVRDRQIETLNDAASRTLTLRVFAGERVAMASAADPGHGDLDRFSAEAVALARLVEPDPFVGLPDGPFADGRDSGDFALFDETLAGLVSADAVALAERAESAMRGHDWRATASGGATFRRSAATIALANSRGFAGGYRASACSLEAVAYADDAAGKKRLGWWDSSDRRLAGLEDAEEIGREAARRALGKLGARKVPTQTAPVVWAPEAAAMLVSILGEAANGAARFTGTSFLIGREGEQVGSPLLTLIDDAMLPGRLGTRPFDGEGLPSRRTPIFEEGRFAGFLHDAYSARRAGQAGTASAGRFASSVLGPMVGIGPSNLCLLPGESSPDSIIAGVTSGLYLTDLLGAAENLATGDFTRGAAGFRIEDGALVYPVDELNVAGRLPEMLAGIDAVGADARFFDAISAPTIRVASMTIGGS